MQVSRLSSLWPGRCAHCGARSAEPLCPACVAQDLPEGPRCSLCALRLPATSIHPVCGSCLLHPPRWDGALALGDYVFPNDRLIQRLKFGAEPALGRWLGRVLADRWEACHLERPAHVVAIPLSRERLLERGFNPAWEIARSIASAWRLPADAQCMHRQRQGPSQSSLPLDARRRNIRGAYACTHRFDGQSVLLVDDVITSGATMDEAVRVLRKQGAGPIWVAAALRTPAPHAPA